MLLLRPHEFLLFKFPRAFSADPSSHRRSYDRFDSVAMETHDGKEEQERFLKPVFRNTLLCWLPHSTPSANYYRHFQRDSDLINPVPRYKA